MVGLLLDSLRHHDATSPSRQQLYNVHTICVVYNGKRYGRLF